MSSRETSWYAMRVRSNFERVTADYLNSIGYQAFSPTFPDQRKWSDRVKKLDAPLFKGYVFCHMAIDQRIPALQAPGVIDVVSFGGKFAPLPVEEIDRVRKLVSSGALLKPVPYLNVGDRVQIRSGVLTGLEGILIRKKAESLIVVSIDMLQRSISVEVRSEWIEAASKSAA